MSRRCERCQYDLDISFLLKQEISNRIICPNCGRTLVATEISKVLSISFFVMFFVIFLILPIKILLIIFIESLWVLISKMYLPSILYNYIEEKKDDLE